MWLCLSGVKPVALILIRHDSTAPWPAYWRRHLAQATALFFSPIMRPMATSSGLHVIQYLNTDRISFPKVAQYLGTELAFVLNGVLAIAANLFSHESMAVLLFRWPFICSAPLQLTCPS